MRRRSSWLLYTLVMLSLTGCSPKGGRTKLVVYSPHGKQLLAHYEQGFEKENPDVDVEWVELGSQEILERVRAEREHPQGDVWFGAPAELFSRAAEDGLLDTISPTWAAQVPDNARDIGRRWFGTYLTPEVIAYNAGFVADSAAPLDWRDVGDKRWRDRVILRDPVASGTMRAIFGAILQRSMAATGKPDSGWALLRRIDANTKEYTATPDAMYEKLAKGDAWITLYNMPDISALAAKGNPQVKYALPASGTPMLVDGIGLIKGSNNRTFAMRYIEYVTTHDALVYAADSLMRIPARTDVPANRLPNWVVQAQSTIKTLPLDQRLMVDSLDAWMRAWDAVVRGRSRAQ